MVQGPRHGILLREACENQPASMLFLDGCMASENQGACFTLGLPPGSQMVSLCWRLKTLVLDLMDCEGHIFQKTEEDGCKANLAKHTL